MQKIEIYYDILDAKWGMDDYIKKVGEYIRAQWVVTTQGIAMEQTYW